MCGRAILSFDFDTLKEMLQTTYSIPEPHINPIYPRYNIAPGQGLLAIIHDGTGYRCGELHWGFVPPWSKDEKSGYSLINARAESLHEKPTFKDSFEKKRCSILVNGFYEWKRSDKQKVPYCFQVENGALFSLAGLWTSYKKEDGSKLHSCTIITTGANTLMQPIHHRMPVILSKVAEEAWLNPHNKDLNGLQKLLIPYPSTEMSSYQVDQMVNSVKIDSPQCILPV